MKSKMKWKNIDYWYLVIEIGDITSIFNCKVLSILEFIILWFKVVKNGFKKAVPKYGLFESDINSMHQFYGTNQT